MFNSNTKKSNNAHQKVRSMRLASQMLQQSVTKNSNQHMAGNDEAPALSELGITKNESSTCQKNLLLNYFPLTFWLFSNRISILVATPPIPGSSVIPPTQKPQPSSTHHISVMLPKSSSDDAWEQLPPVVKEQSHGSICPPLESSAFIAINEPSSCD